MHNVDGLDGATEPLALKRDNLVAALKRVALEAEEGGAALPDGLPAGCTEGAIVGYMADNHSYMILPAGALEASEAVEVPAACVCVPDGSAVVVCGLSGAAEHNGKPGHVIGRHAETGRVEVALTATQRLRLKRANMRA